MELDEISERILSVIFCDYCHSIFPGTKRNGTDEFMELCRRTGAKPVTVTGQTLRFTLPAQSAAALSEKRGGKFISGDFRKLMMSFCCRCSDGVRLLFYVKHYAPW